MRGGLKICHQNNFIWCIAVVATAVCSTACCNDGSVVTLMMDELLYILPNLLHLLLHLLHLLLQLLLHLLHLLRHLLLRLLYVCEHLPQICRDFLNTHQERSQEEQKWK